MDINNFYPIAPPYLEQYDNSAFYSGVFTPDECNSIIQAGEEHWKRGETGSGDPRIRQSDIVWIHLHQDNKWIWERLRFIIEEANTYRYRMDIHGFFEALQLTRYKKKEYYSWHTDMGSGTKSRRKLSCVVSLTCPTKYTGGGTQIFTGNKPMNVSKEQGSCVVFPSYTLHRAKKVKKGCRHTLVAWLGGPPLK